MVLQPPTSNGIVLISWQMSVLLGMCRDMQVHAFTLQVLMHSSLTLCTHIIQAYTYSYLCSSLPAKCSSVYAHRMPDRCAHCVTQTVGMLRGCSHVCVCICMQHVSFCKCMQCVCVCLGSKTICEHRRLIIYILWARQS